MSKSAADSEHVPASLIWAFKSDRTLLTSNQLHHFALCDRCVGILGMCWLAKSVDHFHQLLQEHGFASDGFQKVGVMTKAAPAIGAASRTGERQ